MTLVLCAGDHRRLRADQSRLPILDPLRLSPHQVTFIGAKTNAVTEAMTLAMLRALTELRGVNAVVSIGIHGDSHAKQELIMPDRPWLWFYMDTYQEPFLCLTHVSGKARQPISHLYEWLGDLWPSGVGPDHADYATASVPWQDSANWLKYFERRIRRKAAEFRLAARDFAEAAIEARSLSRQLFRR